MIDRRPARGDEPVCGRSAVSDPRCCQPDGIPIPNQLQLYLRYHTRCPEAREVCAAVEPDARQSADGADDHRVACFIDDAFDVGYEESLPIESETGGGFEASLTSGEGESR